MDIRFLSWNINGGLIKKKPILENILHNHDILCLQEHFLTNHSLSLLDISSTFKTFSVPAKRSASKGRASGGIATYVASNLNSSVFFSSDSFLAVRVGECVIINVYLPTDYKDEDSERDFALAVSKLSSCLRDVLKLKIPCLIVGDFNCDLNCGLSSASIRASLLLGIFGDDFKVQQKSAQFTYIHSSSCTSNLDHVVSYNLDIPCVEVVSKFQVSDHLPIASSFKREASQIPVLQAYTVHRHKWYTSRDWNKIDTSQYIEISDSILNKIRVPFHLLQKSSNKDINEVRLTLDIYSAEICHALLCAEKRAVPLKKIRVGTQVPGWSGNLVLSEACDRAKFWYKLWRDCLCPRQGIVNELRKVSKKCFAKELALHRSKMQTLYSEKVRNSPDLLWKLLPRTISSNLPDPNDIPLSEWISHFSNEFSEPDPVLESQFCDELCKFIDESPDLDFVVTCDAVIKAISQLKKKASCGIDKVSTLHIINGSYLLVRHLSLLMQMIFVTGIVPSSFCIGDLSPIPKKGKSELQCSSFRPITVSTTTCKLFELLFLDELRQKCYVPPYQFGFQANLGCSHALTAVFTALADAESSGESMILAGHDVRRAFDSLIHSSMLLHMARRGVNRSVVRVLRDLYRNLKVRLKLPSRFSLQSALHPSLYNCINSRVRPNSSIPSNMLVNLQYPILVKKGTRQGAITSPTLFNNSVLEAQAKCLPSCILGRIDMSLICYADDILNLSRTIQRIEQNFKILKDEYSKIGLSFNPEKSEVILFNWRNPSTSLINMDGSLVKPSDHITYLGLPIGTSIGHTRRLLISHVERKISISYAVIVKSKLRFNRYILASIYNATALPHLLYIAPFWRFFTVTDKKHLRSIFFRFAKYLLHLPPWTRNRKIIHLYKLSDPNISINKSLSRFQSKFNHPWSTICSQ